jgi:hypothetical protein
VPIALKRPAPKKPATNSQIEKVWTLSYLTNHPGDGCQDHKHRREAVKSWLLEPFAARMSSMSPTGRRPGVSRNRPLADSKSPLNTRFNGVWRVTSYLRASRISRPAFLPKTSAPASPGWGLFFDHSWGQCIGFLCRERGAPVLFHKASDSIDPPGAESKPPTQTGYPIPGADLLMVLQFRARDRKQDNARRTQQLKRFVDFPYQCAD